MKARNVEQKKTRKLKFILQRQITSKNMNNNIEAARSSEVREVAVYQTLRVQNPSLVSE
jgi:hypothetical protein